MPNDQTEPGRVVQDYVRAKCGRPGAPLSVDQLGGKLDPQLRERIDRLGVDDEKLLGVRPEEVFHLIEQLEHDALREDSGVSEHRKASLSSTRPSGRHAAPRRSTRPRR